MSKIDKDHNNHEQNNLPSDELNHQVDEAAEKAKELSSRGREMTRSGQFIFDLAKATKDVNEVASPGPLYEDLIHDWSSVNKTLDNALDKTDVYLVKAVNNTAGTTGFTTSDAFNPSSFFIRPVAYNEANFKDRIDVLQNIVHKPEDKNSVRELLKEFGFDKTQAGKKSFLELFDTAHNAFDNPVEEGNPISTSLIPMRSAIQGVIAELIRLRPIQEKAKNEWAKIQSIGEQLRHDYLPVSIIKSWAQQWERILNQYLSPAKEESIDRSVWSFRLNQATLFLKNLLEGIDPNKLR